MTTFIKGQGAQKDPHQRFSRYYQEVNEYTDFIEKEKQKTKFIEVYPKTIVNKVQSPDLSFEYSLNPYQGCEHGCSYCYARPTHEYWNYNAGSDFERVILVKKQAPQLLEAFFKKKNYTPKPILISGNTDCYQPCEQKYALTRQLLELCVRYKHPVMMITKNALIQRDTDLLQQLNAYNLIKVSISINTLNEELRQKMEPRTSTILKRIETIQHLSNLGIPVNTMIAPIIPGLNSHEVLSISQKVSEAGALTIGSTIVRLNHTVYPVFKDWLQKAFPDRADKVLNRIKETHGGSHQDSRFVTRMKGEGTYAESIQHMIKISKRKYFKNYKPIELSVEHFDPNPQQLNLFS